MIRMQLNPPSDENATDTDANQTSSLETGYPLDFCVVSGNDFGEHPEMIPYTVVYENPDQVLLQTLPAEVRERSREIPRLHEGGNRSLGQRVQGIGFTPLSGGKLLPPVLLGWVLDGLLCFRRKIALG